MHNFLQSEGRTWNLVFGFSIHFWSFSYQQVHCGLKSSEHQTISTNRLQIKESLVLGRK